MGKFFKQEKMTSSLYGLPAHLDGWPIREGEGAKSMLSRAGKLRMT